MEGTPNILHQLDEQDKVMIGMPSLDDDEDEIVHPNYLPLRRNLLTHKINGNPANDDSEIAPPVQSPHLRGMSGIYQVCRQHLLRTRKLTLHKTKLNEAEILWKQSEQYEHSSRTSDTDSRMDDFSSQSRSTTAVVDDEGHLAPSPVLRASPAAPPPANLTLNSDLPSTSTTTTSLGQAYSFTGMHHIFAHNQDGVTSVEFAHDSKDMFAFGSLDCTVTIASASRNPDVLKILKGHSKAVNGIAWSMDNQRVISVSDDQTARVWDVASGECLRIAHFRSQALCARFHPLNDNAFFVGTVKDGVLVHNLSTGKMMQQLSLDVGLGNVDHTATSLDLDAQGQDLFVGTARGCLHHFRVEFSTDHGTPSYKRVSRMTISNSKATVTSVRYNAWHGSNRQPSVLCNVKEDRLVLISVHEQKSRRKTTLKVMRQMQIKHQHYSIGSRFCPLISSHGGVCIVAGSEDTRVYVLNVAEETSNSVVNCLSGHNAAVLDVAWAYDESLMASADASGVVILWRREPREILDQEVAESFKEEEEIKNMHADAYYGEYPPLDKLKNGTALSITIHVSNDKNAHLPSDFEHPSDSVSRTTVKSSASPHTSKINKTGTLG